MFTSPSETNTIYSHLKDNLESLVNLMCIVLVCGRKLEYPVIERIFKVHIQSPQANGIKPITSSFSVLRQCSFYIYMILPCMRQCQKCYVVMQEQKCNFCDSLKFWLQSMKAFCVGIRFCSLFSIRQTLMDLGRVLDHTRSPLAQESPASMSLSLSSHLPAAHLFCPPPEFAVLCNSDSPAHHLHCMEEPKCPGMLLAPPLH